MDLRDYVEIGLEFERRQLNYYRMAITKYVDGSVYLRTRKNAKDELYIKKGNEKAEYVKKSNANVAASIIMKHRAEVAITILEKSIKAREQLLKRYEPLNDKTIDSYLKKQYSKSILEELGSRNSKIRIHDKRLTICTTPSENAFERGAACQQTKFGLNVRSRIEVMIAEALFDAGITFRYEEELKLYDEKGHAQIRYPDFTIHCSDGRKIYWEHAGMYDNPDYAAKHNEKLKLYFLNDIVEPVNLIVTMENRAHELDMESIWRIITGLIKPVA